MIILSIIGSKNLSAESPLVFKIVLLSPLTFEMKSTIFPPISLYAASCERTGLRSLYWTRLGSIVSSMKLP